MKMIQKDRILRHIKEFGSISSFEAFTEYGITQLATRIFELKRDGYEFDTEVINTLNRYGEKIHYTKYSLI